MDMFDVSDFAVPVNTLQAVAHIMKIFRLTVKENCNRSLLSE